MLYIWNFLSSLTHSQYRLIWKSFFLKRMAGNSFNKLTHICINMRAVIIVEKLPLPSPLWKPQNCRVISSTVIQTVSKSWTLYTKFQHRTILFWNAFLSKGRRKGKKIFSTKDFRFVFSSNIEWGDRKIDCVPVTGTLERPSLSCVWVLAKVRVESSDGFSKTDPEPNYMFSCMLQYSRLWRRCEKN